MCPGPMNLFLISGNYLRNIKGGVDDSELGTLSDLMTRFMVLPHSSASVEIIFSRVNHVKLKRTTSKSVF